MAIRCSKCNLYHPSHVVRNGVREDRYEDSEFSSSEDEESSSSDGEIISIVPLTKPNKLSSKTCTKCKITKEFELFHKNRRKKGWKADLAELLSYAVTIRLLSTILL